MNFEHINCTVSCSRVYPQISLMMSDMMSHDIMYVDYLCYLFFIVIVFYSVFYIFYSCWENKQIKIHRVREKGATCAKCRPVFKILSPQT